MSDAGAVALVLVLLLLVYGAIGLWGAAIARRKGRGGFLWGAVAVAGGIWAIPFILLLPDRSGFEKNLSAAAPQPKRTAPELERLAELHGKGALSDEEFEAAKANALRR